MSSTPLKLLEKSIGEAIDENGLFCLYYSGGSPSIEWITEEATKRAAKYCPQANAFKIGEHHWIPSFPFEERKPAYCVPIQLFELTSAEISSADQPQPQ